jgi:HEAT repeat protein
MLMLRDPHRDVACNAAELLGVMEVTEAQTALTTLRGHEEECVRRAAAVALARLAGATSAE